METKISIDEVNRILDIYVTSHLDMIGDVDYYYTFTCGVCGRETDISDIKIPYAIRIEKIEKYKEIYSRRRHR